jgi:hypothetical protein
MLGSDRHGHAEACKCPAVAAQNRRIGRRRPPKARAVGCGLWASAAVCRYEKDELKTTMFVQRAGWNTISTMMYPIGGRPDSKTLLVRLLKPRARGWLL